MKRQTITLTLKNIGPFAQANLELRPITIITGESSTGKTFLLKLLYILLHSLDQTHRKAHERKGYTPISEEETKTLISSINGLAKQINMTLLKENTSEGEISLSLNTPHQKYDILLSIEKEQIKLLSDEIIRQLKSEAQPITKQLLIPEDRLFSLKYILPITLELLSKSITEVLHAFQEEKYSISIPLPESLRAMSRSIPQYVMELLNYTILTINNPLFFNEALELTNKIIQKYGTIKPKLGIGITFTNKLGHQTDINTAPEAIMASTIPILPLPSFLNEKSQIKLILIDHIETNLTPPLTEALVHSLIQYITKREDTILVITAHNLDTLVSLD
ncbi:hypothetical protein DRO24_02020, partial [Candidatus Bathyarchaeota archaeon]